MIEEELVSLIHSQAADLSTIETQLLQSVDSRQPQVKLLQYKISMRIISLQEAAKQIILKKHSPYTLTNLNNYYSKQHQDIVKHSYRILHIK